MTCDTQASGSAGALKLGLRIPACARVDVIADAARRAEQLGYDAVWFPDSQLLWRDVWVAAAFAAARTERIQIGTAVTNFETRHPTVTASAARTVQELAGDRLVVGIGTGNSSLSLIGATPTTRRRMRESIELVRALLAGDDHELGGGFGRLRDTQSVCPLYMAASGPRNTSFAAGLADGVILLGGTTDALLRHSIELIDDGARAAGRRPASVPIVVSAFTHVTDDVARDARILKPICAALAVTGGARALAAAGIEIEQLPPRLARVYPDLGHAEDWDLAVRAVDEHVSDEAALRFAQAFCLFGSESQIRARLAELSAAGVTEVLAQHIGSYDLPEELMETFASAAIG
jgi:5,10-methylenetetrahydromethanopterin reductase